MTPDSPAPAQPVRRGPLLDPGWPFLVAGVILLSAVVLLPAQADLDDARLSLARVHAAEAHRADRLERYQRYLGAVQGGDERVIRSLAATQLNQAPEGQELLVPGNLPNPSDAHDASVFGALEPPTLVMPQGTKPTSVLERLATNSRSRLWLIGGGALCLLIGLLPAARSRL